MSIQLSAAWLIFAPLFFVPLVYLFRRWGLGEWLAALVCLGVAYLMFQIPRGEPYILFGRLVILEDIWAYTISLLFVATACLFILSSNVSQGWSFYPFGLLILTLFSFALLMRHLGIIALIIEIAALLSIFIIQGGRLGSVRAALRFLVMMTLAVPIFLLAAWQSDLYRDNPDSAILLTQLALLLAGGFGLWLGVAPLHGWMSAIALEAKPGISAFILITFPTVVMVILLHTLAALPQISAVPNAQEVILLAGLFTAIVGGVFAAVQKSFGPLMGYTAIFVFGTSLAALGLDTQLGLAIIFYSIFVRTIALILIASAIAYIHSQAGGDAFEQAHGGAHLWRIATIGLMVGGFTLAGVPFTAGFVSRWLLLQSLAGIDPRWPVIIILGGLGVALGFIRALRALLQPATPRAPNRSPDLGLRAFIIAFTFICLAVGLFPAKILESAQMLAQSLNITGL